MSDPFPIIRVLDDARDSTETIGSKDKFWYWNQDLDQSYLFKLTREGTGEDWSERIAAELCRLLRLPHAEYDFAIWRGQNGVVTKNMVPEGGTLVHGNELLSQIDPGYEGKDGSKTNKFKFTNHTINNVIKGIEGHILVNPLEWQLPDIFSTPIDIFVGYLLLDAWIGNTDRHHQNWGIIWRELIINSMEPDGPTIGFQSYLAPTYDHASSLGRNETDENRQKRLEGKDRGFTVQKYVEKCTSAFYNEAGEKLKTFEAFELLAQRYPKAAEAWLDQLGHIETTQIDDLFRRVPAGRISPPAIEFALKILEINRERLLNLRN